MSVLVLGGTSWLGGHVARSALALGHEVTCLARGVSGRVPDGARLVRADRASPDAYAGLPASARWDLVVEVTWQPGFAEGALAALGDRAEHWAFVSSCSVYADHATPGADESAALLPALEGGTALRERYGEAKVACEGAVTAYRGGDALVARSGLIAGHGDRSDRFGYWPGRFARAAGDALPVLVPERLDRPAQLVDVRDLAAWIVRAGLGGVVGPFNAAGPVTTLGAALDAAKAAAGFSGDVVLASDEALATAGVAAFMGPRSLPLWLPDRAWAGFLERDTSAAAAAGLSVRGLPETARGALEWEVERGLDRPARQAGLTRAEEREVLATIARP